MHTALQKKIAYLLLGFSLGGLASFPAQAQTPSFGSSPTAPLSPPTAKPLALPDFTEPQPGKPFVLPKLKAPSPSARMLSNTRRLHIKKIKLTGNTRFSEQDLQAIITPYEGREITTEALHTLRNELTLFYVNHGYINSGVIIPDQKVQQGIITLQVIEGRLSQLLISGNERLSDSYLRDRLMLGIHAPLNVHTLQTRLQLLRQNPLIQSIQAELGPGNQAGEARLHTKIKEARPYEVNIGVNNRRSPSIGAENASLHLLHRNLSGWADALAFRVGLTEGLQDAALTYRRPLTASDTQIEIRYEQSTSDVVEAPFDDLDIESESSTFALGIQHPLVNTPSHSFSLGLRLEIRHSETALLGRPFSFSAGVQNGKSDVTVLRFSQEWLSRSAQQVIAARSIFSFGLDAFEATTNSGGTPDGRFQAWLGQFQWARRLPWQAAQLIFRLDGQYSNDPLLPLEKFAVGGANSVRGYRENQLVRDHGLSSSLEMRIPLFPEKIGGSTWQLAPFIDFGWSENRSDTTNPRTLSSAGLGLHWDPNKRFHAQVYWGQAFRKVENNGHDLQDDGVHFLLAYRLF